MQLEVKRVNNDKVMQAFLAIPSRVYGEMDIPPWAAASTMRSMFNVLLNPGLKHIEYANFVAFDGNQPVGRITAAIDSLNPRIGEGFWGSFECIDSTEVAAELLETAAGWLREKKKNVMLGPATLNTNQYVGLLIKGFESEVYKEIPYNPPYYQNLVESTGLVKAHDLECYKWHLPETLPNALQMGHKLEGVIIRPINYFNFIKEAKIIQELYNKIFPKMWGFLPITHGDAQAMVLGLVNSVPPDLFLIAEVHRKPAGIHLAIPHKKPQRDRSGGKVRLAIGGVMPEFRKKGLHRLMLKECYKQCRKLGLVTGEVSQVTESNDVKSKIISPIIGKEITKIYRVYKKDL
ncbi:hypothetical protein [Desulfoscipio gibsoniae]|uniref:N-acetyltransferase domain-containing protein n=1 Tax=Desulfoscipio gibsoniae DSM 7213 TaxID=767817 RepID=R4KI97_9FIRM|nr:hypothetical protein [Desulfoscipio gibsoniae]AGL02339.1 hypothetical protein Desgi_2950 [Desulfoscipio gibsoniae DSM 7213]